MGNTRTYVHDEDTIVDAKGNEVVMLHKNTVDDVVMDPKSKVTARGKIIFSTESNEAANVAEKTASIPGYSLVTGAHLVVKFTHGISVANATLNVNNLGAKAIMLNGAALPAGVILANNQIILKYNGSAFDIVGGAGSTRVSKANAKKLYFIGIDNENLDGTPANEYFNTSVYVSADGQVLTAPYLEGDGSKLTNMNASQLKSGTLNAARLAASGVTAGSYGSSAKATLGFGDTFAVPYTTVDKYGRVTAISSVELTMPANPDTDVKVTSTADNSSKFYFSGTTSAATATGTLKHNTGVYVEGNVLKSSTAMMSPTMYFSNTTQYITGTSYTGQAATVATIAGHLNDTLTSTSTSQAATANAARQLSANISAAQTAATTAGETAAATAKTEAIASAKTSTQNAINSLINQLGTQATFSLSGSTLTITTKTAPAVTVS